MVGPALAGPTPSRDRHTFSGTSNPLRYARVSSLFASSSPSDFLRLDVDRQLAAELVLLASSSFTLLLLAQVLLASG